jgi:type III pantothenate kinase
MHLLVDIGNSHTVTGVSQGGKLLTHWRLPSNPKATADDLGIAYHTLFTMSGLNLKEIETVVISSVVPTLQAAWQECCTKHFPGGEDKRVFTIGVDSVSQLISVQLDTPKEVGADRLVNSIAAWNARQGSQIVIDFGTAITFDCVSQKCEYLGGAILPGIAISLEALVGKTAKLPLVDITATPRSILGKSTVEAMKSGILYGYGAMIDGLVKGLREEILQTSDEPCTVVATGGMAKLIAPFSASIDHIEPLLTLHGLEIIYQQIVR